MSKRFKANSHGKVIGQYPDEDGRFMAWGWRFPDGALIICLDRGKDDEMFHVRFRASNMKASDIIAACEIVKAQMMQSMGYLPEE